MTRHYTEAEARAFADRLHRGTYTDTAALITWLADQVWPKTADYEYRRRRDAVADRG